MDQGDFKQCVNRAQQAGLAALERSVLRGLELQEVLHSAASQLAQAVPRPTKDSQQPAATAPASEAAEHVTKTRLELARLNRRLKKEFHERIAELRRCNDLATIVFFGRTKAGKSTTLEALADGDGSSIGVGRQHTTRKRTDYLWPRDGEPFLRLVDTPGVEGFKGKTLARLAEEYVDVADQVFFVLTADKATAGELDYLGAILQAGKPVTVLLNVKEKDLDLVIEAPEHVFDANQLAEHKARISEYLQRHFGVTAPQTIIYHAHAAFESNRAHSAKIQRRLRGASGIVDIEQALKNFLSRGALNAKLTAPRDLVSSYLIAIRQVLQQLATTCERLHDTFVIQESALNRIFRETNQQAATLLEDLATPYHAVNGKIPELVDNLIAVGKSSRQLESKWQSLLSSEGVASAAEHFADAICALLRESIEEASRIQAFDARLDTEVKDEIFSEVDAIEDKAGGRRLLRVGIQTAGSVTTGLAAWAALNFWNPSGWLAGVGALGAMLLTYGGGELATRVTDRWAATSRRDTQSHRNQIIETLRADLWAHHRTQKDRCKQWLHDSFEKLRADLSAKQRDSHGDCIALQERVVSVLSQLDTLEQAIQRDYLAHCIELILGPQRSTDLRVERISRKLGFGIKAVVSIGSSRQGAVTRVFGAERIRELSMLVGESVALVTAKCPLVQQVAEALYPAQVDPDWVSFQSNRAVVSVPASEVGRAMGQQGDNARLAGELVGYEIFIVPQGKQQTSTNTQGESHVHH